MSFSLSISQLVIYYSSISCRRGYDGKHDNDTFHISTNNNLKQIDSMLHYKFGYNCKKILENTLYRYFFFRENKLFDRISLYVKANKNIRGI